MATLLQGFEKDIFLLLQDIQKDIDDECRAFEGDESPGIQLTIGWSSDDDWAFQTGDNSYSGAAYGHPIWAVVGVYRDSNLIDLTEDIVDQITFTEG